MISGISRQNNAQARPVFGSTEFVGKWTKAESHIQKAIINFASQDTLLEPINKHGLLPRKLNAHEPHITAQKKNGNYVLKYLPLGLKSKATREIKLYGNPEHITEQRLKDSLSKNLEDIKARALYLSKAYAETYPTQEKAIEKGKIAEKAPDRDYTDLFFWPAPPAKKNS